MVANNPSTTTETRETGVARAEKGYIWRGVQQDCQGSLNSDRTADCNPDCNPDSLPSKSDMSLAPIT